MWDWLTGSWGTRRIILIDCGKTFREQVRTLCRSEGRGTSRRHRRAHSAPPLPAPPLVSTGHQILPREEVTPYRRRHPHSYVAHPSHWPSALSLTRVVKRPVDHHADAIDGLDDLRAWTYGDRAIEDHIPIFCTRETYKNIAEVSGRRDYA